MKRFGRLVLVASAGVLAGYCLGALMAGHFIVPPFLGTTQAGDVRKAAARMGIQSITLSESRDGHPASSAIKQAGGNRPSGEGGGATRLTEFHRWSVRDPVGALGWFSSGGWREVVSDLSTVKTVVQSLRERIARERSEQSMTERLAWLGMSEATLGLSEQWKADAGVHLAKVIQDAPDGWRTAWQAADAKVAGTWTETAEWVSELRVDAVERSRILDHLMRRGVIAGEREALAVWVNENDDPSFDGARSVLVYETITTQPELARSVWETIGDEKIKAATALLILGDPKASAALASDARWDKVRQSLDPELLKLIVDAPGP